jgi:putative DNA primase/helicase
MGGLDNMKNIQLKNTAEALALKDIFEDVKKKVHEEKITSLFQEEQVRIIPAPDEKQELLEREMIQKEKREKNRDLVASFFNEGKFMPVWMADHWINRNPCFSDAYGTLFVYRNGVYEEMSQNKVESHLLELLSYKADTRYTNKALPLIVKNTVKDKTEFVELMEHDPYSINLGNGIYHLKEKTFKGHSSNDIRLTKFNVNYDPTAVPVKFNKFLREVLPEDVIPTIYEIFGYCLLRTNKLNKSFLLVGEGANGKSIVLEALKAFLGTKNFTTLSLQQLTGDNAFATSNLFGKYAVIDTDTDGETILNSGNFKKITSGESIHAEFKGKDGFTFTPFAKLIYSVNNIPQSVDKSNGYFRRWTTIPFNVTIPEEKQNKNLAEEICSDPNELSGILNEALAAIKKAIDKGQITESETIKASNIGFKQGSDTVQMFIDDCCVVPGEKVLPNTIFMAYKIWCNDSSIPVKLQLGKQGFYKDLEKKGFPREKSNFDYFMGIDLNFAVHARMNARI